MLSHRWATAVRAGTRLLAGPCLVAGLCLGAAGPAAAAAPRPVVTSVHPASTATSGGTITVRGHGFSGTSSVSLLSLPSASVTTRPVYVSFVTVSDSTLRLTVPAHEPGTVWIQVTTASGSNLYGAGDRLVYSGIPGDTTDPAGKDALGALLLAILIGMMIGRGRSEETPAT